MLLKRSSSFYFPFRCCCLYTYILIHARMKCKGVVSHLSVTRDERISSLLVGKDRHRSRHLTRPCSTWDTHHLDPRTTYRAAIDTTRTFPPPCARTSPSRKTTPVPDSHLVAGWLIYPHTTATQTRSGITPNGWDAPAGSKGNAHSPRGVVGQRPTATQQPKPNNKRKHTTPHPPHNHL